MKKRTKIIIYVLTFIVFFLISAFIRIQSLGGAPMRLLEVEWDESVGVIHKDLNYENDNGNKYDLYIPTNLDKEKGQNLILYIHGGSFNSGSKEDGEYWCKYYASKGYITATLDYTLQNQGKLATLQIMNQEIENVTVAIKEQLTSMGIEIDGMAPTGVSAGGTLAMNFAYSGNSAIPVKFVFQLAGPTYFDPVDWGMLMKVNGLKTDQEFIKMMTGQDVGEDEFQPYINEISPASQVDENSVPSLIGYGLIDHVVPANQKEYLMESYENYQVSYDYIPFPNSNHGMYNDLDKLQDFIDKSLEYCDEYFD